MNLLSFRAMGRAVFLLVMLAVTAFAQSKLEQAKAQIETVIAASGAEVVGVAVYDLQSKQTLFINEKVSLHAASTMKLPVMMEVFRLVEEKKLRLTDPIEVKNKFFSIMDGSEYRLNKTDDSDEEVYNRIGQKMTVLELTDHMITWSSNLATNILIERAGPENIMKLMAELGANDIRVLRGVEDSKAFRAGKNNTTTAYDLMVLLRAIAENKFKSKRACEKMVEILAAQHFNDGIPAGLPTATKVAHKTGEITKHKHDAGIVYPIGGKPYVIVVLTKGIESDKQSGKLIAEISRLVYGALRN
ncbi:MAG: serine hydrolase [Acidobacteriota bacterium]|nr:serine hydrolase [Acidobacteriota bacterium]